MEYGVIKNLKCTSKLEIGNQLCNSCHSVLEKLKKRLKRLNEKPLEEEKSNVLENLIDKRDGRVQNLQPQTKEFLQTLYAVGGAESLKVLADYDIPILTIKTLQKLFTLKYQFGLDKKYVLEAKHFYSETEYGGKFII